MSVVALDRCLDLLEGLAGQPEGVSLGEIADRIGIPKSAAHRLLATLVARGYVRQEAASQNYLLSLRLAELGFRILDARHLPDLARPVLNGLASRTGEYCRLALMEGGRLAWVARAQGAARALRYEPPMGQEVVLHATATGKAWLATMPEQEALRVAFAAGFGTLPPPGPRTLRCIDDLRADLQATRRRGYAVAIEEGEPGVAALAAVFRTWDGPGAPVAGTISVAGPVVRLGPEERAAVAPLLLAAAKELAALWPLRQRQRARGLPGAAPPIASKGDDDDGEPAGPPVTGERLAPSP